MEKTTQELLQMMKDCKDYTSYFTENKEEITTSHMKIDRALNALLQQTNFKKSEVIAKSGIENHYAYQLFSGEKAPSRDKVIMLCIGFELSAEKSIELMKITGYAPLYSKDERDNAILFGITKNLSLVEINGLLYELGLELLL